MEYKGQKNYRYCSRLWIRDPKWIYQSLPKVYGYNPTPYTAKMTGVRGYLMKPVIITKPSFKIAGYGIKTTIADGSYTKDVSAFLEQLRYERLGE
ncbi:hypothetical protein [Paenibacillus monticola]|uniref:Uncharacterized protein n=1 Tax=Paenibacillus monticola TaxID=2666075 RepID=A0A7X2HAK1_9BACL|nr:hypothetical protein [Paenibacillus monticola]MRN56563.1 hypothetical protein [Paenibacillus monticola]